MNRKRDMDLIRSLMLEIEEGKEAYTYNLRSYDLRSDEERRDARKLALHLDLLQGEGLAEFYHNMDMSWDVIRITRKGYDFLDSARDPDIWERTKAGAAKVGSFTADTLLTLAKGYIKQKTLQHTGIEVDL